MCRQFASFRAAATPLMKIVILIIGGLAAMFPSPARAKIAPALLDELDQAVALQRKGEWVKSYHSLRRVVEDLDEGDLEDANQRLRQAGANGLEGMLFDLRMEILATGDSKKVRMAKGLESRLLVTELHGAIDRLLTQIDEEMPAPGNQWNARQEIEEALRGCSLVTVHIEQARRFMDDMVPLARNLPKPQKDLLDAEIATAAANRFEDFQRKVDQAQRRRDELHVELHFRNIETSLEDRFDAKAPLAERLAFVARVANSIEAIRDTGVEMSSGRRNSKRESKHLYERLAPLESEFHRDFLRERSIAYDLESGTRWWIRGRFGKGIARMGLLKEFPAGGSMNRRNLLACPLLMPDPIPEDHDVAAAFDDQEPVISYVQAIHPTVTRRHYVLWGSFANTRYADKAVAYFLRQPPTGTLEYAYFADSAPDIGGSIRTGTEADRIVGFVEYQMALAHFHRMLKLLDAEEKEELDRLVARDRRLRFYANVSRLYDPISKNSSLRDPFRVSNGDHARAGLRWVLAFARVELSAMEVGIQVSGTTPLVTPSDSALTSFDAREYRELLWDAARTHYYSMRFYLPVLEQEGTYEDGGLVRRLDARLDYPLLKQEYALAGALCKRLQTLFQGDQEIDSTQRAELSDWIRYLEQGEYRLNGMILSRPPRYGSPNGSKISVGTFGSK